MSSHRDEIEAAVAAYDRANPLTPLPRSAAPLLTAMFPTEDVCQHNVEAIAALGFSRRHVSGTLQRLLRAGFLSVDQVSFHTYHLHLPPVRR